jgi:hypothetical protein
LKYFHFPISNIALSIFGISGDFSRCKDIEISKCRTIFSIVPFYLLEILKNYYIAYNNNNKNFTFQDLKKYFDKIGDELKKEVFENKSKNLTDFVIDVALLKKVEKLNKKTKNDLKKICKSKNLKYGNTKTDLIFSIIFSNDCFLKEKLLLKNNYSEKSFNSLPLFVYKLILKANNKPTNCKPR